MLCSFSIDLTDMPMAPPLGELAGASPTERARMLPNSSAKRSYRSDNEPAYRCAAALGRRACPLRHACGVPPLPKGEALAFRIASCIFLLKFMVYLFCGLARALTPDQQDGVGGGETPCCCCRRTCFFKLYADKLEKRRFTQNVQPQKNCGLLWHYR